MAKDEEKQEEEQEEEELVSDAESDATIQSPEGIYTGESSKMTLPPDVPASATPPKWPILKALSGKDDEPWEMVAQGKAVRALNIQKRLEPQTPPLPGSPLRQGYTIEDLNKAFNEEAEKIPPGDITFKDWETPLEEMARGKTSRRSVSL
ncbi:MAG: hypothetical protein OK454_08075 [Thaumarchaeota archaeon]|nr:hypothetical protein [Nitrososphaerota archaeon]